MKIRNELIHDFDITSPKVTASCAAAVVEHVRRIVEIADDTVVIDTGRYYVSLFGRGFLVSEIWEGRMVVEGTIERIEFFKTKDKDSS